MKIIKVRMKDFMVHFSIEDSFNIGFSAFPVTDWYKADGSSSGTSYLNKEDDTPIYSDNFNEKKALKKFMGSYCYRGVFESRIYFTDDEYWGEELSELSDLFINYIEPWCKKTLNELNVVNFKIVDENKDTSLEKINNVVDLANSLWYEHVNNGGGHPGCKGPTEGEFWSSVYGNLKGAALALDQVAEKIKKDKKYSK